MPINVIIADNSAFLRKVISEFLSNHNSISVLDSAKTGKEAVKKVKKYRPDVLILDLLILDMNGLEALKLIMDECPTPTIILSEFSFQNIDNSMLALLLGAFDYIIKPGELGVKDLSRFKKELLDKVLIATQSHIKGIIEEENLLYRKISLRQDIINKTFKLGQFTYKKKTVGEIDEKKIFLRQSIVNKDFELGKQIYDTQYKSKLDEFTKIEPNEKEIVKFIPENSLIKTNIRQDTINKIFKLGQSLSKEKSVELDDIPKIELIEKKIDKKLFKKPKIKQKKTLRKYKIEKVSDKEILTEIKLKIEKRIEKAPDKEILTEIKPKIEKRIEKAPDKEVLRKEFKKIKPKLSKIKKPKPKKFRKKVKKHSKQRIIQSIQKEKQEVIKKEEIYFLDLTPIKNVYLRTNLIVIGASLGGPQTVTLILKEIPKDFPCPILIVQHLTAQFIDPFVKTLNEVCEINVKVAENEEFIQPRMVYIAPGDNHMEVSVIDKKPCIQISKGIPVHFCMPSIDVLFFSAARVYKNRTMGVLLTGMGGDGVAGLGAIQFFGGKTITESQKTCVLYGMPKLAAEQEVVDLILPNYEIKKYIRGFAKFMI
jgi:chemotaxis response regulator CheB